MKNLVAVSILCSVFFGCASTEPTLKIETEPALELPAIEPATKPTTTFDDSEPFAIFNTYRPTMSPQEYDLLRKDIGIQKDFHLMGFSESAFQTCTNTTTEAPQACRVDYYSNIHFLLLCRDAHESSQTAFDASRMQPLGNRTVKWNLKDQSGVVVLDDKGYGRINLKSTSSQKAERLKLSIDNETLYVQAGEIGRVVTPPDWCR